MNSLEGLAVHWGQWMTGIAWQLGLLVLVLTALTWMLRKKSAAFLHALWLLALVRLVVTPAFAFPTGWGWWLRGGADTEMAQADQQPSRTSAGTSRSPGEPATAASPGSDQRQTGQDPAGRRDRSVVTQDSNSADETDIQSRQTAATSSRLTVQNVQSILMLGWAGVSLALLGMLARGQYLTWQWIRKAQPNDDKRLTAIMDKCCRRIGIKRKITIRDSEACSTPLVVGLFRPIVLLPTSVPEQLSDQELEAVITHELAHVVRHDALVNLFQGILAALYFFNPLVWWANHQIHRLREEACDELTVTALNGRRKAYGSALIKVTEILGYSPSPLALGVMEAKNSAKRRLSRILDPDLPRGHGVKWTSAVFVAVIGAMLLPCGQKPSAASIASAIAFLSGIPKDAPGDSPEPGDVGSLPKQEPADKQQRAAGPEKKKSRQTKRSGKAVAKAAGQKQSSGQKSKPSPKNSKNSKKSKKSTSAPRKVERRKADPVAPVPWRYLWKAPGMVTYDVRITAEDAKNIVTHRGHAYLHVTRVSAGQASVQFRHSLVTTKRRKRNRPFDIPRVTFDRHSFPAFGLGQRRGHGLTLNDRGRVLSIQESSALPYFLGNLSQLCVIRLPQLPRRSWQTKRDTELKIGSSRSRIPSFFPRTSDRSRRTFAARITNRFQALTDQTKLIIHRDHQLVTLEKKVNKPIVLLTGEGEWEFDLTRGLVRKVTLTCKLLDQSDPDQGVVERSIVVSIREVNAAEAKRRRVEAERRRKAPLDLAKSDKLAEDLASGERSKQMLALAQLRVANPNQNRDAIVALILPLLKSSNGSVRKSAQHAFVRWAGAANVEQLVRLLGENDTVLNWSIVERLGRIPSPISVRALTGQLNNKGVRAKASDALIRLGSRCEPELLKVLRQNDEDARIAAIRVLEKVGTKKSIAPLQRMIDGMEKPALRLKAVAALAAIKRRQSK